MGGTVIFRSRVTLIEGTTPAVVFTDVLPAGLSYVAHQIAVGNLGMVLDQDAGLRRIHRAQDGLQAIGREVNLGVRPPRHRGDPRARVSPTTAGGARQWRH